MMKRLLLFLAFASVAWCQCGQQTLNPLTGKFNCLGKNGTGASNISATSVGSVTSLTLNTSGLNVTNTQAMLVQCWTGTTTFTPVAITSLNPVTITGGIVTVVTPNFSATGNVYCTANANGGAGPTGPAGPSGAAGPTGATGPTGPAGSGSQITFLNQSVTGGVLVTFTDNLNTLIKETVCQDHTTKAIVSIAPTNATTNTVTFTPPSTEVLDCYVTTGGVGAQGPTGPAGGVTSIATTGPITGGTITTTGTIACATCTVTIASGTSALGTGAISGNTCATVVTTTATGTASTDAISWTPNADISGVTGYGILSTDGLKVYPYPTTNNVNFRVCNGSASSITPGAVTLNWRVVR